jgi:hypothetical protein
MTTKRMLDLLNLHRASQGLPPLATWTGTRKALRAALDFGADTTEVQPLVLPKEWVYLAMTANFWGWSTSPESAVRKMKEVGGTDRVKDYGFVVYHVHPDFEINGVNGDIMTPRGVKPVLVQDKRKRK